MYVSTLPVNKIFNYLRKKFWKRTALLH